LHFFIGHRKKFRFAKKCCFCHLYKRKLCGQVNTIECLVVQKRKLKSDIDRFFCGSLVSLSANESNRKKR
jgi:hypothetical protein